MNAQPQAAASAPFGWSGYRRALLQASHRTPVGSLTVLADVDGVVYASGWTASADALLALIARPLRPPDVFQRRELGAITAAIDDYLHGELDAIDDVPVKQSSGEFIEQAWATLRRVRPGQPISYRDLAVRTGHPNAPRAAACACGRNAAALFVPCHRVVRTGGALGGFRWGLEVKRWLLSHEAEAPGA